MICKYETSAMSLSIDPNEKDEHRAREAISENSALTRFLSFSYIHIGIELASAEAGTPVDQSANCILIPAVERGAEQSS